MNPVSHEARTNWRAEFKTNSTTSGSVQYVAARDEAGIMGFTRRHEKGHSIPQAAIASILHIAALHRSMPNHHAIYIDKVRKLRKTGTWL